MTSDFELIIFLLVINLIVSVIYLLFHLRSDDRKRGIVNFCMFLIFPVVGISFMALAWIAGRVIILLKNQGLNMKELSFNKERIKLLTDDDIEKELNTVPIEEALIVAEKKDKRSSFIDVLKSDDYQSMMGQIHEAVEDNDMEVSHYAAAFVTDSIAKFKAREAELRKKVDHDGSVESIVAYIKFMEENFKPEIYSIVELHVYVELLDKAAAILYETDPNRLDDAAITQIVQLWDIIGDEYKVRLWITRAKVRYRESLECFKLCARYYYSRGNREELKKLIQEIKRYSVPLDNEALGWIRILKLE